jgi:hypothetical protein
MAENNSAASMAASSMPMKVETLSIPGFGGGASAPVFDPLKYRVRYGKYDLDDMGAVADLENIETAGLTGTDIVVLNKDKFVFMDRYLMVVTYLEKIEPV